MLRVVAGFFLLPFPSTPPPNSLSFPSPSATHFREGIPAGSEVFIITGNVTDDVATELAVCVAVSAAHASLPTQGYLLLRRDKGYAFFVVVVVSKDLRSLTLLGSLRPAFLSIHLHTVSRGTSLGSFALIFYSRHTSLAVSVCGCIVSIAVVSKAPVGPPPCLETLCPELLLDILGHVDGDSLVQVRGRPHTERSHGKWSPPHNLLLSPMQCLGVCRAWHALRMPFMRAYCARILARIWAQLPANQQVRTLLAVIGVGHAPIVRASRLRVFPT